jgi:hypothetical protein
VLQLIQQSKQFSDSESLKFPFWKVWAIVGTSSLSEFLEFIAPLQIDSYRTTNVKCCRIDEIVAGCPKIVQIFCLLESNESMGSRPKAEISFWSGKRGGKLTNPYYIPGFIQNCVRSNLIARAGIFVQSACHTGQLSRSSPVSWKPAHSSTSHHC